MRQIVFAAVAMTASAAVQAALPTQSVSFQNGIDGYAGAFDMRIGEAVGAGAEILQLGSTVAQYYVDGRVVANGATTEADVQGLIRFDNIIGTLPGQIPAGAYILDARLRLTTGTASLANTGSRVGIAAMLQPFGDTTNYGSFGPNGPDYANNTAARTTGWLESSIATNEVRDIRATQIVQSWASGLANNGLAIQYGVRTNHDNGWQIRTTGAPLETERPALLVTYVDAPVQIASFQQGVQGYDATSMAWLRGGPDLFSEADDLTLDGAFVEQAFLDGGSPYDHGLIKFDKLFVSQGGSVPDNAEIVQALLKISTGDGSNSPSSSVWEVSEMLVGWDTTQTFTSFGGNGPDAAGGELGAILDTEARMLAGSTAQFDITSAVKGWQTGGTNHGLNIQTQGTDGWQIHFTGSADIAARPELVIAYVLPTVTRTPGDADNDSDVDLDDFSLWQLGYTGSGAETATADTGDFDADLDADLDDFAVWQLNYTGALASAAVAVPEPAALSLLAVAGLLGLRRRRA